MQGKKKNMRKAKLFNQKWEIVFFIDLSALVEMTLEKESAFRQVFYSGDTIPISGHSLGIYLLKFT